ncbi:unnamed protein product [Sphagnum jensenii]|uniref:J domain-containing protein n=1 Tax=Sphagnum jensenii TaxID=128206 RepID=A0ABP0W3P3_9BRYO
MSRTGTMVDALRNVSEFSRASRPEERRGHRHKSAHSTYNPEEEVEEEEDRGERKRMRQKGEEAKSRHARRRRSDGKSRTRKEDKEVSSGESSDDDESSGDDRRQRHSSRKKRKKEDQKKKRRKKRRGSKHSRAAASTEDDSEEFSESLSSEEEDDDDKRRERRHSSRKHHHRKQERQEEEERRGNMRKGRRKNESKQRTASSTHSEEESSETTMSNPDAIASEIAERFPEDAKDLKLLLEMLDSGQAVDISGLPNKSLVSLLRSLFRSLNLMSTQRDIFLLPEGAQATVEIMSSFFEQNAGLFPTESNIQLPPTSALNDVVPGPSVKPVETKKSRVMGPAMPSADMLAAAARLTEAESLLREAEKELENDPLVGPPPPSVVAEAESANDAERFEEVTRMVARDIGNAYDLLGVKPDVNPTVLKKRYWKLSLLVHPDKCSHPQAHEAFMALNQAFKDLQDPSKKAIIDRKVAEKQEKEEMEAEIRAQREAAQWRRVRGEAQPGDDEILRGGPQEPSRDEWMTALPPERQAGGPVSQQNTFFSKAEKSGRGDTSIWTDTPADKAQKAKMQYLEAYKQATLTNEPGSAEEEIERREKERSEKEAQLMDSYNSNRRLQSLVEKHKLERSEGSKKKKKKQPQGDEKQAGKGANRPALSKTEEGWAGSHPWKPWDREKDLTAGRQSVNLDPKKFTEGLTARFGATQDAPRKFL